MYKKTCLTCNGDSYSASSGRWVCPYCKADLSRQIPMPAGCRSGADERRNSRGDKIVSLILKKR